MWDSIKEDVICNNFASGVRCGNSWSLTNTSIDHGLKWWFKCQIQSVDYCDAYDYLVMLMVSDVGFL